MYIADIPRGIGFHETYSTGAMVLGPTQGRPLPFKYVRTFLSNKLTKRANHANLAVLANTVIQDFLEVGKQGCFL